VSIQDQLEAAANLNRFIETARRGAFPGASSGERIANKIANLLGVISDDAAVIDLELIEGACEMLRLQHGPWRTDADKIDVFRLLDRALGR
jgi:hypothetical protein